MAKQKTLYICQNCGQKHHKWAGKCHACNEWNTIEEEVEVHSSTHQKDLSTATALGISDLEAEHYDRIQTDMKEFNHVCGGGIVPGSVILIGGEPGIGKSTLLLQLCNSIKTSTGKKPLYISGEEAASQVGLRARRLGVSTENFNCAFGTNLSSIYALMDKEKPSLVIIDSIQTMHYDQYDSSVGTVGQIRICSQILTQWAKDNNIPVILVGHITKEGSLAGPKILEHMVDVVLYFEGERTYSCRMLRAVKNRFGPTDEVGIFEMAGSGLQEVSNPSKLFFHQTNAPSPGVIIFPSIEGTRPLLVEIQALTLNSYMQMPKRSVVGWDTTRLSMIAAVLETKLRLQLSKREIYINIAGGLKIFEPGTDLASAIAIASSYMKIPLKRDIIAFGEISLSGEIRPITRTEARLKEAGKLGIKTCIAPVGVKSDDVKIINCQTIYDVMEWLKGYSE